MMPATSPPRWQRRADARPQELLDAALAEFIERGYVATRLDTVARRAGVAKATLYRYYANKFELFKAVVRSAVVAEIDELAANPAKAASAREELAALLSAFFQRIVNSPLSGIPKLVIGEAGNFPEIARFYHDEVIDRARALVLAALRRGIASGEFRAIDADYGFRIAVAPLLLAIIWKHSFQACEPQPLDFDRYLAAHLDLLLGGLTAPSAEAA
ncbi:MAG: TetR/AcrR family transcriptional regulator [Zoogloeaceae bacterium]|nr:TetR/AcrR family transcriptional regulator [Zoogloeaceae bacterium]